jgi:hypothetical protein
VRLFYDLEGLWMDARRVKTRRMKSMVQLKTPTEDFDD